MLGKRIRELREKNGLSQEMLAERMNLSRQAVSKWENGVSRPDTANLIALSKLFSVPVEELVGGKADTGETGSGKTDGGKAESREDTGRRACSRRGVPGKRRMSVLAAAAVLSAILAVVGIYTRSAVLRGGTTLGAGQESGAAWNPKEEKETHNTTAAAPSQPKEEETSLSVQNNLNSPDSVAMQNTAQNFAKAYFSGDRREALRYSVIGEEELELSEIDIADQLDYMILKWDPEDLVKEQPLCIQYQYRLKGEDSAGYLGLELMKINDEWKVTSAYLEK